jgi:hypothetical protein
MVDSFAFSDSGDAGGGGGGKGDDGGARGGHKRRPLEQKNENERVKRAKADDDDDDGDAGDDDDGNFHDGGDSLKKPFMLNFQARFQSPSSSSSSSQSPSPSSSSSSASTSSSFSSKVRPDGGSDLTPIRLLQTGLLRFIAARCTGGPLTSAKLLQWIRESTRETAIAPFYFCTITARYLRQLGNDEQAIKSEALAMNNLELALKTASAATDAWLEGQLQSVYSILDIPAHKRCQVRAMRFIWDCKEMACECAFFERECGTFKWPQDQSGRRGQRYSRADGPRTVVPSAHERDVPEPPTESSKSSKLQDVKDIKAGEEWLNIKGPSDFGGAAAALRDNSIAHHDDEIMTILNPVEVARVGKPSLFVVVRDTGNTGRGVFVVSIMGKTGPTGLHYKPGSTELTGDPPWWDSYTMKLGQRWYSQFAYPLLAGRVNAYSKSAVYYGENWPFSNPNCTNANFTNTGSLKIVQACSLPGKQLMVSYHDQILLRSPLELLVSPTDTALTLNARITANLTGVIVEGKRLGQRRLKDTGLTAQALVLGVWITKGTLSLQPHPGKTLFPPVR